MVTRRRSTSQGGKTSSLTSTEGEEPNPAIVYVCVLFLTLTNGVALKQRPGSSSYCNAVVVAAIEAITMVHRREKRDLQEARSDCKESGAGSHRRFLVL